MEIKLNDQEKIVLDEIIDRICKKKNITKEESENLMTRIGFQERILSQQNRILASDVEYWVEHIIDWNVVKDFYDEYIKTIDN
jgi:GTP1/Obg family GTP-binding protein